MLTRNHGNEMDGDVMVAFKELAGNCSQNRKAGRAARKEEA